MKKIIYILLCIIFSVCIFAETESWGTLGFQYGNYWEKFDKPEGTAKTWIGSPGIVFNAYAFFNKKNIGLFISDSFLFPNKSSTTINGATVKDGLKDFDFRFLFQFGIGPAFKYPISEKLNLHSSVGFHISMLSASIDKMVFNPITYTSVRMKVNMFSLTLGIMGDIGFKYDITDMIYFDIGSKLAFDFAGHLKMTSNFLPNISQWNSNYFGLHLNLYIGLGLILPF